MRSSISQMLVKTLNEKSIIRIFMLAFNFYSNFIPYKYICIEKKIEKSHHMILAEFSVFQFNVQLGYYSSISVRKFLQHFVNPKQNIKTFYRRSQNEYMKKKETQTKQPSKFEHPAK